MLLLLERPSRCGRHFSSGIISSCISRTKSTFSKTSDTAKRCASVVPTATLPGPCPHYIYCIIFTITSQCFFTRFSQNFATVRVYLYISGIVMIGARMTAHIARGMAFLYFFTSSLVLCPSSSSVEIHCRWYHRVVFTPNLSAAPAPRSPTSAPALSRSSSFSLFFTGNVRRSS